MLLTDGERLIIEAMQRGSGLRLNFIVSPAFAQLRDVSGGDTTVAIGDALSLEKQGLVSREGRDDGIELYGLTAEGTAWRDGRDERPGPGIEPEPGIPPAEEPREPLTPYRLPVPWYWLVIGVVVIILLIWWAS